METKKTRNCDSCGKKYSPDQRNLKRGWGLCCSKACAAKKRETSRTDYDPETVQRNNLKRESWRYPPLTTIKSFEDACYSNEEYFDKED